MLQAVLIIALLYFGYVVFKRVTGIGGGRQGFKCATCKNCGKLFDDGVLCRFQGRETFKNETHIANCIDHEKG